MDAVWNIEDKTKISTAGAIAVFSCITLLLLVTCMTMAIIVLKKRLRNYRVVGHDPDSGSEMMPPAGCSPIKKALMRSIRWSNGSKWAGEGSPELLLMEAAVRRSHNSMSPVWQRPILMGEKCELPCFSGVILYDESGRPLHQQEENAVRITLRELLL
ncbi:uncharacterized protein LOC124944134 [Impatiens glandulifera]|uniref:uncharacterized protein LOC124944134 n=1 Tax=Impatiens glandulifera TaxID=253017 RepID=UPI001FB0B367|nr:uncharacterized protein LOC124944134 [Impatiens glandulifera]